MNEEHFLILNLIKQHLEENPHKRFCQILFDLRINEFADKDQPEKFDFMFRDNYMDTDEQIIDKLKQYDIY